MGERAWPRALEGCGLPKTTNGLRTQGRAEQVGFGPLRSYFSQAHLALDGMVLLPQSYLFHQHGTHRQLVQHIGRRVRRPGSFFSAPGAT